MAFSARIAILCMLGWLVALEPLWADVVVIANKSKREAKLDWTENGHAPQRFTLRPGSLVVRHTTHTATVRLVAATQAGGRPRAAASDPAAVKEGFRVEGDSAYFLHEAAEGRLLGFDKVGLADEPAQGQPRNALPQPIREADGDRAASSKTPTIFRIPVKILADDDERAARRVWEARLRHRIREASQLFEAQFAVGFDVVAVDTWASSNGADDFAASLSEFEHAVRAEPAKIAIGFTSQYQAPEGTTNIGGTRVPLGSHILVREWSQRFSERERLELLLHELGHYLGAVHSPEADSVMRPLLGDRQALAKDFVIGFDPLNALAIGMVAEQLPGNRLQSLTDLPPAKIARLGAIYATMLQVMPEDAAAPQLLALIGGGTAPIAIDPEMPDLVSEPSPKHSATKRSRKVKSDEAEPPPEVASPQDRKPPPPRPRLARQQKPEVDEKEPFVLATRQVLAAIVDVARHNTELSGLSGAAPTSSARLPPDGSTAGHFDRDMAAKTADALSLDGDELTELYVRAAAAEALKLPSGQQAKSFLWGLAIGLERREEMRRYAVLGDLIRLVESDRERKLRLKVLGQPTWRGREDLSQHFSFSAAIMSTAGKRAAEAAGMAKELRDARTGSGFSFADWAADLAGIALAERMTAGDLTLEALAGSFRTVDYLPDVTGLEEGLSWEGFGRHYGSTSDRRFRAVDTDIRRNIERLYLFDGRK